MSAIRSASVPDERPMPCFAPQYAATSASSRLTAGPRMKCCDAATLRSAASISGFSAWYCGLRSSNGTFMVADTPSQSVPASLAAIGVIEADDVVLAEIAARLHLDDLQRFRPRVLDAMYGADRNVGGLVLGQREDIVAARNARRALHDDPMLGAVSVLLERELCARLDREALHLEARPGVDAIVAAPGAEHLAVQPRLGAARLLHPVDEPLDVLD